MGGKKLRDRRVLLWRLIGIGEQEEDQEELSMTADRDCDVNGDM